MVKLKSESAYSMDMRPLSYTISTDNGFSSQVVRQRGNKLCIFIYSLSIIPFRVLPRSQPLPTISSNNLGVWPLISHAALLPKYIVLFHYSTAPNSSKGCLVPFFFQTDM